MNKRLGTGLVVMMLCIVPIAASALTTDDVQARIRELMAKVSALNAQIKQLQGQAVVTTPSGTTPNAWGLKHRVCNVIDRSLAQGQTNDDVKSLQEFLKTEGYLNAEASGYFGALTKEALIRWQASQGVVASPDARIAGAGLFGPKTKERLRIWCGGQSQQFSATPTRGDAPLTVTFSSMVGGLRPGGITYSIDYGDGSHENANECSAPADACVSPGKNTHTYASNGTYTATLSRVTDPCFGQPACKAAIHSEVIGKVQISVGPIACTKEYRPVCGAQQIVCITAPCNPIPTTYGNKCEMEADGASFLYEGQCRSESPADDPQCKAWFDGCNSCARNNPGDPGACTLKYCAPGTTSKPYCTARFDTSANKAPTISGFSGPTTLATDAEGTWKLNAKDPEGGELNYQVWWGDENVYASNYTTAAAAREFTQSTTFTHAYANPGTYTVFITVRDSGGQEAKTSMTVKVTDDSSGVVCTEHYEPVCGRPAGCANTCQPGMMCPAICQLHEPKTYSNRCYLNAAKAEYLHSGQCQE
jgi:hypothetical protein